MGKAKSALLGGLATGILSGIPFVNIGCCLWAIGGGVLAAFLYFRETGKITLGEGTMVGLYAGLVAGVIAGAINILIGVATDSIGRNLAQLQSEVNLAAVGAVAYVFTFLFWIIILGVFCLLGGLIGGAIFQNMGNKAKKAKKIN
ncbi:MAG: hypothetical protein ACOCVN_03060 [bacterium]